ncbi:MAG: hypothetical protein R3E01_27720 [Pirellulaceae bacterium]|nr:hypothetical protein [Planctomycetales bacterium]
MRRCSLFLGANSRRDSNRIHGFEQLERRRMMHGGSVDSSQPSQYEAILDAASEYANIVYNTVTSPTTIASTAAELSSDVIQLATDFEDALSSVARSLVDAMRGKSMTGVGTSTKETILVVADALSDDPGDIYERGEAVGGTYLAYRFAQTAESVGLDFDAEAIRREAERAAIQHGIHSSDFYVMESISFVTYTAFEELVTAGAEEAFDALVIRRRLDGLLEGRPALDGTGLFDNVTPNPLDAAVSNPTTTRSLDQADEFIIDLGFHRRDTELIHVGPSNASDASLLTSPNVDEFGFPIVGADDHFDDQIMDAFEIGFDTARPIPGGTGQAFAGHGTWNLEDGFVTVPEGTTITLPRFDTRLADNAGQLLELGDWDALRTELGLAESTTAFYRSGDNVVGLVTYLPGAKVPNLTLHPPGNLSICADSINVSSPTRLSDLLQPHSGNRVWAACTTIDIGPIGR